MLGLTYAGLTMLRTTRLWLALAALLCGGAAAAQEKYAFRENVKVAQKIPVELIAQSHDQTATTVGGQTTRSDTRSKQVLKLMLTVLAVKDGSATEMRADVHPDSYDTTQEGAAAEIKTPCSFAGKSLTLRRRADESVANDFPGQADPTDLDNLNSALNPDQDFFPDHSVAIGDVWDVSEKVAKHSNLGPLDQLMAQCRLDWVKTVDGRKWAQMSCSCASIMHQSGNVEADLESTMILQVDVAASQIVQGQTAGSVKYLTPNTEPTQINGTVDFTCQSRVLPATRPQ
jgi:hypothetical protein